MRPASSNLLFVFITLVFMMPACQKEYSYSNPDGVRKEVKVMTDLAGIVVDDRNVPVAGAKVMAGNVNTVTDGNGAFRFTQVYISRKTAYVTASKEGYFTGSRTFVAAENSESYITIGLIPNESVGSFSAANGGRIILSSGGSIELQPNAVFNSVTKGRYSGTVYVAAHFLDPMTDNFSNIMPGDLRAIAANGQDRTLLSFGMMAVALRGANGEHLQLDSVRQATLRFPIAGSLLAKAPQTIPLWYFDETKGLWKEEGVAVKEGNFYTGKVRHFSFWNVDVPFPVVDFTAVLRDQNNDPIANTKVEIRDVSDKTNLFAFGHSDADGRLSGMVPANHSFQLTIYNTCGEIIHQQTFNSGSGAVALGTIKISYAGLTTVTFSGTVLSCNGDSVQSGFVTIALNNNYFRADITKGRFSQTVTTCNKSVTTALLSAYNIGTGTQSDSARITVTTANPAPVNLTTCNQINTTFINYTINGVDYSYAAPPDTIKSYREDSTGGIRTIIAANTSGWSHYAFISFYANRMAGIYPAELVMFQLPGNGYSRKGTININITKYGGANEYLEGNLSGRLVRNAVGDTSSVPFTCTFKTRMSN